MNSYGQYCPVAKAAEVLGDRWTLLIVRDLICLRARHFNDLVRGLPGISRSLLAQRLQGLERLGIIERHAGGKGRATEYDLTVAGEELQQVIEAMLEWGAQWAFGEPDQAELDPVLLLWWMPRGTHLERLPPQRVVAQFDFYGARTGSYWLLLEPSDVSVCLQHPGFDIDVLVTADIAAFYQVWMGRISFAESLRHKVSNWMASRPWYVHFQRGLPGARPPKRYERRRPGCLKLEGIRGISSGAIQAAEMIFSSAVRFESRTVGPIVRLRSARVFDS